MPTSLHLNNGVCTKIKTAPETFNLEFAHVFRQKNKLKTHNAD